MLISKNIMAVSEKPGSSTSIFIYKQKQPFGHYSSLRGKNKKSVPADHPLKTNTDEYEKPSSYEEAIEKPESFRRY